MTVFRAGLLPYSEGGVRRNWDLGWTAEGIGSNGQPGVYMAQFKVRSSRAFFLLYHGSLGHPRPYIRDPYLLLILQLISRLSLPLPRPLQTRVWADSLSRL